MNGGDEDYYYDNSKNVNIDNVIILIGIIVLNMKDYIHIIYFFLWRCDPSRVMASSFLRILDHTQRRTTIGRTPPNE